MYVFKILTQINIIIVIMTSCKSWSTSIDTFLYVTPQGHRDMEEENLMIVKELETTAVGERNDSEFSQPEKITSKEYLQTCCRISYRMRKLKTKGAILVLMWSFVVTGVLYYLLNNYILLASYHDLVITSIMTIIGVTLPVAGWLADVRFGRYKVMRCSIWTMWIGSVLLTMVYVVFSLIEFSHSGLIRKVLTILVVVILAFGSGGFQAIVVQFGVDQLSNASTTKITSFVAWYTWTRFSSNIIASFINLLTCIDSKYSLIGPLVVAMCLTLVVSTNYIFSNQLIKEPVTQNPFKLVYNVVRYAIKTKHPRQRSAFT
jgi:peptide/histidine transporter 3/4